MKNAFIIFIIFIFLFHLVGYKIVFLGLQYRANRTVEERLQKNDHSGAQTIILKIPITLPYQIHAKGYQKANGTFEHDGKFYHLLKQKIESDTLYVVCLKDPYKAALYSRMAEVEKAVNNWPLTSGKTANLLQVFIKDYLSGDLTKITGTRGWTNEILFFQKVFRVINRDYSPSLPPPK